MLKVFKPGDLTLNVRSIAQKRLDRVKDSIPIKVPYPPLEKIIFNKSQISIYEGTSVELKGKVYDEAGLFRDSINIQYTSSDPSIAEFDPFGNLNGKSIGKIKITAQVENVISQMIVRVVRNPIRGIEISSSTDEVRTGDVVKFIAKPLSRRGKLIDDVPVNFSFSGIADYGIGLPAGGQITKNGRFVAETPGVYTIFASSSGYSAQKSIKVNPRNIGKDINLIGQGLISNVYTSDLWVWPGIGVHEGKDFAVTGTWGGDGKAYFWDVTDAENLMIIDSVKVDARTVNDVKISEDGRVGVITREGASNRKNGFVLLDVSDPFNVSIIKKYNDNLTGGVHNVFIYDDHVYALSAGTRYDVINISDPQNPFRVGSYELGTPGHSIHDVWVIDGLAYSSNWSDGVHVVDVGGVKQDETNRSRNQYNPFLAKAGQGSPGNPVKLGSWADRNGHNHAAFPFISQSTDNFYIITGDEWAKNIPGEEGSVYQGGFHFVDFTDTENPTETAVYQVPEVGSHNHWVHGDTLFAGYYYGGIRIVDISGELMGDLYAQGREIGFFMPLDPEGFVANKANVWGTIPYKGLIYFSDLNSGLWAVKLVDDNPMGTN